MVCNTCDPLKQYRQTDLSRTVIPIPAIGLEQVEKVKFEIKKCLECEQQFSMPIYDQN